MCGFCANVWVRDCKNACLCCVVSTEQEILLRRYQQGGNGGLKEVLSWNNKGGGDEAGRVSCSNTHTHTPWNSPSCSYLMAGLTELTFANELAVQTQFKSPPPSARHANREIR